MAEKDIKGRITCPYCGAPNGMRITEDRNGAPFGFCDAACDGQLRVGGKTKRIDAFLKLHPNLLKTFGRGDVSSSQPEAKPDTKNDQHIETVQKGGFTLFN